MANRSTHPRFTIEPDHGIEVAIAEALDAAVDPSQFLDPEELKSVRFEVRLVPAETRESSVDEFLDKIWPASEAALRYLADR